MGVERPHRLERITQLNNLSDIFIEVDYPAWPRTCALTLEILNNTLQVKANEQYIDEKLRDQNVTSVEFINQNIDPSLPPNTFPVNVKTHIAVDENYLYVWVPISNKWKRILLSDW
jgi:hypothetical protein